LIPPITSALLFIPLFIGFWLLIVSILGAMSGWYDLAKRFPNKSEPHIYKMRSQSGSMGDPMRVNMGGILTLSVCQSGLRIGMSWLFGPFCRDFFIPWDQLTVVRSRRFFWKVAELRFGHPQGGRLRVSAWIANRLAYTAQSRWPEPGVFPRETLGQILFRIGGQWLIITAFAGTFFTLASRSANTSDSVPLWATIGFPAVLFGIPSLFRLFGSLRQ
jgi:hypothetical protein